MIYMMIVCFSVGFCLIVHESKSCMRSLVIVGVLTKQEFELLNSWVVLSSNGQFKTSIGEVQYKVKNRVVVGKFHTKSLEKELR